MPTHCQPETQPAEPCPPANGWPWGLPVAVDPSTVAEPGALAHGPAATGYNWVDQDFEEPFFG